MKRTTKKAKATPKSEIKNVSTFTDVGTTTLLDGKAVARNVATYSRMWHINTDIRRCVAERQETSMKAGYELHRTNKTNPNERVAEDPEFIKALNKFQSIGEMKDEIIMNLDLFGDVYIRKIYNAFKNVKEYKGSKVMGYEILDTRNVKVVTDARLRPVRYIYDRKATGLYVQETFMPDEIRHYRSGKNFDNPVFGVTIMETLVLDVLGDDEASLVNYFWFQNDAIPSALYILNENLGDEEAQIAVDKIKAKLAGGHNKGKDLISNAVKDVKPIAQKHNDADFLNQRRYTTEKVCAAFGVPRTILGYVEDVNHSNGDSQYKKFIENNIRPLERKLEFIFTELGQDFGGFKFVINDEHIDQIEQRSKLARENVLQGIWTRNEARDYIGGYEALKDEELADALTVPGNTQLLDNLSLGDVMPTPPEALPPAV